MKILHVLDHSIPLHSGYTFRTRAILQQQKKLGWQTYHVTSPKHKIAKRAVEDVDGLTFFRSNVLPIWVANIPLLNQCLVVQQLYKRLVEIIPQINPDILHAHSPALNGLAALQAGKKYNIPVVYECRAFWEDAAVDHGTTSEGSLRYKITRALETFVFKRANAVTTICEGLRQDIIHRGISEDKITVIPNAVDIDQFQFNQSADVALKQQLQLEGCIVLGFIGSFYAYEGLSLLLEALPDILQRHPDCKLLLVGGGPQQDALKQQAAALQIEPSVIFTGRVSHETVADYYNLIDILIYPRLSMRLTDLVTPLKPLEAMAQGKIFMASDVGGHKELIDDGVTGCLFKAGDKTELARRVNDLLDNRQQWENLKQNGRQFVEQQRNWKNSVARYQSVYSKLRSKP
jgi:PEP-CTERM/exosortase A-associated glycosyltransferase